MFGADSSSSRRSRTFAKTPPSSITVKDIGPIKLGSEARFVGGGIVLTAIPKGSPFACTYVREGYLGGKWLWKDISDMPLEEQDRVSLKD